MLGKAEPIAQLDQMRLFVYDGHGTQTISMLSWLRPVNLTIPAMTEYATQISFELFSSERLAWEVIPRAKTASPSKFSSIM